MSKEKLKQLLDIANELFNAPEETGDAAALRADNILLRGMLKYVYQQNQKLQLAIDPMYTNSFDDAKAQKADDLWKTIHRATGNYQGDTQTIIGEEVNIPIPDMVE